MIDIYDIVKDEIVEKMDNSLRVVKIVDNGGTYTLTICNSVKWARVKLTISDAALNAYTISAVDYSARLITVTPLGAYAWTSTTGTLQKPKFFIGTPMRTNEEWLQFSNDERNKVPFIWMVEPTQERVKPDSDGKERESDIRIVFIDSNNSPGWITTDVHEKRLKALYNMVSEFFRTIENNPLFGDIESDRQIRNLTRFGTETSNGFERNIIDADLTGIDARVALPIMKQSCKC